MRASRAAQPFKWLIPSRVWPHVVGRAYPALRPRRRGARVTFERLEDGTWNAWFDGYSDPVNFLEAGRAERMVWPGGPLDAARTMLSRYLDDHCHPQTSDVVLDVGANIGEFSLIAAEVAGTVIAIEGDPGPFRCLKRNTTGLTSVQAVHAVVGEREEDRDFFLSTPGADSSLIRPHARQRPVKVSVRPLDALLDELGISRTDFLKLDAEGAEPEVLRGAPQTLARCRAAVVDAGPERGGETTVDEVMGILRESGMRVWQRNSVVFGLRE